MPPKELTFRPLPGARLRRLRGTLATVRCKPAWNLNQKGAPPALAALHDTVLFVAAAIGVGIIRETVFRKNGAVIEVVLGLGANGSRLAFNLCGESGKVCSDR